MWCKQGMWHLINDGTDRQSVSQSGCHPVNIVAALPPLKRLVYHQHTGRGILPVCPQQAAPVEL